MNRQQRRSKKRRKPNKANDHDMVRQMAKARALSTMANRVESDRHAQRALWLAVLAVHDAFGIGADRMGKFFDALQTLTQEYAKMRDEVDDEYANDKLRQAAERVTGIDIRYLYEDELKRCSK